MTEKTERAEAEVPESLVKIEILDKTGIKHGYDRYEHGDVVSVPESEAKYFCNQGWAKVAGSDEVVQPATDPVNIAVDKATHTQKTKVR